MKRTGLLFVATFLLAAIAIGGASCRSPEKREEPSAKSTKSFDEICKLVAGKTAAEVKSILGPPDNVYPSPLGNERWTWWNYTFLDGNSYPPEIRKRVVHLEIVFENPGLLSGQVVPASQWRVSDELSVSYQIPDSRICGSGPARERGAGAVISGGGGGAGPLSPERTLR